MEDVIITIAVCVCVTGDSSLFVDQFCPSCDMACSFSFSKRFRDAIQPEILYTIHAHRQRV